MQPRDLASLADILLASQTILRYLAGVNLADFDLDPMRQDAVVRQIEIIGEAARRLSESARADLPMIPWTQIIGMRNVLIHAYDHVDVHEVWRVAQDDIPALIVHLLPLIPPEDPG